MKADDEVKFAIARVIWLFGIVSAVRTEVRLSGPVECYDFDVECSDRKIRRARERSLAITQASISGSGVIVGLEAILRIPHAHEHERSRCTRAPCYC